MSVTRVHCSYIDLDFVIAIGQRAHYGIESASGITRLKKTIVRR